MLLVATIFLSTRDTKLTLSQKPAIRFNRLKVNGGMEKEASWLLARFGASCLQQEDKFVLLGGVARDHLLCHRDEVILCSLDKDEITITSRLLGSISGEWGPNPRPLFVGHSVVPMPDSRVMVVGGGATCFSMGTFWNKWVYTLQIPELAGERNGISLPASRWMHEKTIDIVPIQRRPPAVPKLESSGKPAQITAIPRLKLETTDHFLKIVRDGKPVVLEGLDLGSCVSAWTPDYLVRKVGADRKVGYHFLLHAHALLTPTDRHP